MSLSVCCQRWSYCGADQESRIVFAVERTLVPSLSPNSLVQFLSMKLLSKTGTVARRRSDGRHLLEIVAPAGERSDILDEVANWLVLSMIVRAS